MAAERPRRLIAERAPFGLRMKGKPEEQMLRALRRYHRNTSLPMRCEYASCAVVGSSGSLRENSFGQAIDAHEAVIRINAAPVHPYEEAVGTRTTWRVHNSEKPFMLAAIDDPALQVPICHMPWIGSCQHTAFSGAFGATVAMVNPVFYSQLWGLLGRPKEKQAPSTGMLALALALGACGRVSVYGFGRAGKSSHCRHYWECDVAPDGVTGEASYYDPLHSFHDWMAEERLRARWLRLGVIEDGPRWGAGAVAVRAIQSAARYPRNRSALKLRLALHQPQWATELQALRAVRVGLVRDGRTVYRRDGNSYRSSRHFPISYNATTEEMLAEFSNGTAPANTSLRAANSTREGLRAAVVEVKDRLGRLESGMRVEMAALHAHLAQVVASLGSEARPG